MCVYVRSHACVCAGCGAVRACACDPRAGCVEHKKKLSNVARALAHDCSTARTHPRAHTHAKLHKECSPVGSWRPTVDDDVRNASSPHRNTTLRGENYREKRKQIERRGKCVYICRRRSYSKVRSARGRYSRPALCPRADFGRALGNVRPLFAMLGPKLKKNIFKSYLIGLFSPRWNVNDNICPIFSLLGSKNIERCRKDFIRDSVVTKVVKKSSPTLTVHV